MKAEILREAYDYKGQYIMENFEVSNFVRSFIKDCEMMGESAINLYKTFFFIDEEDIRGLYNSLPELKEMAKVDSPFIFEDNDLGPVINEGDFTLNGQKFKEVKTPNPASPNRSGPVVGSQEKETKAFQEYADMFKAKKPLIPTTKEEFDRIPSIYQKYYKVKFEDAAKASTAEEAAKILQQAPDLSSTSGSLGGKAKELMDKVTGKKEPYVPSNTPLEAPTVGAAKAAAAAAALKPKGPTGILGFLANIWGKIKGFFGSGIKSIGDTVSSGNWAGLMKIPLVQSALVVSGVGVAFAIIKKLLGKKAKGKEAEIKAALEAKAAKA